MERFAVIRQALAFRARPSPASESQLDHAPVDRAEPASESRLAGLLVLLIPVAGLAWLGIGWLIYRLVT